MYSNDLANIDTLQFHVRSEDGERNREALPSLYNLFRCQKHRHGFI